MALLESPSRSHFSTSSSRFVRPASLPRLLLHDPRRPRFERTVRARVTTSDFWVLSNFALLPHLVAKLLVATVMMTTLVVSPFYLKPGLGLNSAITGLVMSIGPAISILGGIPSGRAVDAMGARLVVRLGLALLVVGASLLSILPAIAGALRADAGPPTLSNCQQHFRRGGCP